MGVELLVLSAALGAAGSVVGAAGAIKKGKATQQSAEFNAEMDRQRAAGERDQAAAAQQDYLRKGSNTEATAVALQGATGVTGEGSPLMVNEDTVRAIALGASRIHAAGEAKASRLEEDAKLNVMKGKNAVEASYYDAGSSLLSGAGKIASAGSDYKLKYGTSGGDI